MESWELIETLWNVNKIHVLSAVYCVGINRNIVECKFNHNFEAYMIKSRINRNIVECKFVSVFTAFNWFSELIETLWNVNEGDYG